LTVIVLCVDKVGEWHWSDVAQWRTFAVWSRSELCS